MKRFLKVVSFVVICTLVLLGLSFFPINDYRILASDDSFTPSPSPLVVEQFTGGWCGYCPIASACLNWERLVEYTNNEFVHLAFHNGDQMAIAEGGEREKYNKIAGFPALVFGGVKKQEGWPKNPPSGDMYSSFIKEGISNQRSIADIYIKGSSEPKQFELKVKAKEDFGKRNINLVAVIYEDWVNILSPNGDAFHRNVVRNMPYGGLGRAGIKLKTGQIYEETRKFALQTKNWDNIGILVFLQDIDNKEILGSGLFKYATKTPAIYYWGDEFKLMGEVNVKTCNNKIKFSVKNASELSEVFVKVKIDSLNYDLIDAKVSQEIGPDNATIQFNGTIGEIRINLKQPITGDKELFNLTIKFKQKADAIVFQIIKFVALDKNNAATPFELIDLTMFSFFKVIDNPYDLDSNLKIDDGDVSVLIERFGTMKKDKGFEKKYDLTKDGRVDMKDVSELMKNLDTRIKD